MILKIPFAYRPLPFDTMNCLISPYSQSVITTTNVGYFGHFTFNGNGTDYETGYSYFGARYLDHELMTMWLSVDPMADKYPGISPYAYCAWNPVKLVDPDGNEIVLSDLSKELQGRLCKCLEFITGLKLSVNNNGRLVSDGMIDEGRFSASARADLLAAIEDQDITVNAFLSENWDLEGDFGDFALHEIYIGNHHEVDYDNMTEGLGMMFMHELGHAYFGDNDPTPDPSKNSFVWNIGHGDIPYPNSELSLGGAVERVNRYRSELGMLTRASYEQYIYQEGDLKRWKDVSGKVPFQDKNGKITYMPLR